tara:strand:- start:1554 stop:1919 length:366 start_codon:yes stop_codon:yes gene_type:complete
MISGRINLAQLKHVIQKQKGKTGMIEGVFIPIKINDLFKTEKGNIYLDLIAFDAVNKEYKQTHAIKQSFSKEKYEGMTDEERKSTPFLGHLNVNVGKSEQKPNIINDIDHSSSSEDDNLPF